MIRTHFRVLSIEVACSLPPRRTARMFQMTVKRAAAAVRIIEPENLPEYPEQKPAHPSATSRIIISVKPAAKATVPRFECFPSDISGISSSTTTYIMAPAAKLRR